MLVHLSYQFPPPRTAISREKVTLTKDMTSSDDYENHDSCPWENSSGLTRLSLSLSYFFSYRVSLDSFTMSFQVEDSNGNLSRIERKPLFNYQGSRQQKFTLDGFYYVTPFNLTCRVPIKRTIRVYDYTQSESQSDNGDMPERRLAAVQEAEVIERTVTRARRTPSKCRLPLDDDDSRACGLSQSDNSDRWLSTSYEYEYAWSMWPVGFNFIIKLEFPMPVLSDITITVLKRLTAMSLCRFDCDIQFQFIENIMGGHMHIRSAAGSGFSTTIESESGQIEIEDSMTYIFSRFLFFTYSGRLEDSKEGERKINLKLANPVPATDTVEKWRFRWQRRSKDSLLAFDRALRFKMKPSTNFVIHNCTIN